MKRAFCVAAVLLVLGPIALVTAGLKVNSQSESVEVAGETLYGNVEEAAGLKLRVVSQWRDYLVWDTEYHMGSGDTESCFSFYPYGKRWKEQNSAKFDMKSVLSWGLVHTGGGTRSTYDPDAGYLAKVIRAVMERTDPGEKHTENVRLKEYYEYFPLEVTISNPDINLHYDDNEDFFTNYFHIPVPEWETLEITLEKDGDGDVTDIDCRSVIPLEILEASAFGQDGGYCAYYMKGDAAHSEVMTGADYGIYYFPYVTEQYRSTIDTEGFRKVCDLQLGMWPVDMKLNEELGELYLVTVEEQDYYLNVYDIKEEAAMLKQKLYLRSVKGEFGDEGSPYWNQMSARSEGVLMVWRDGSFAFAARDSEGMSLWYLEEQPWNKKIFPYEHNWAFDGRRLALVFFEDWEHMSVEAVIYRDGELSWQGILSHSQDIESERAAFTFRIKPPGTRGITSIHDEYTFYRKRNSVTTGELLGVEWE